ncbi:MAG: glycosyltransferase family 2 protein [Acidimicrobiia bacterium]
MSRRPSFTLVLPAYNEAPTITEHLETFVAYLRGLEDRYDWELLVVNDGSTDATGELAETFAASHANVRVLHHFRNYKLGQALRYAFANSHRDYIVTFDVDLSYSTDHIERMLDEIVLSQAKIVVASPYMKAGKTTAIPFTRRVPSRVANWLLSLASRSGIHTITGMVRAYDRRFIQSLNLKSVDNELNAEIIYTAELLNAYIVEIPAHLDWTGQQDRREGTVGMWRMTTGFAFSGFLFRPFVFFTLPGLVILVLALYTLGWSVYHTLEAYALTSGGFDPRLSQAIAMAFEKSPHSFVVGGTALVVGIQLLSLGLLSAQKKRYFEELFHLGATMNRRLVEEDRIDRAASSASR